MSEGEKQANKSLAAWLFAKAIDGKPGKTLDVGCGYPILAYYLITEHQCYGFAMDGDGLPNDLNIPVIKEDFETADPDRFESRLDLITFVHAFEHLSSPLEAMKKCRRMIADSGVLFIRLPDHQVSGYERDLTEGHATIHPYFYCLISILEMCLQTRTFVVKWTGELHPGQRDVILSPL